MIQTHLPIFPEGVTNITADLAFKKEQGIITYFNLKETPQEKRKILLRAKTEKEANKEANEIAEKWKRELKNEGKKGTIMWHLKKDNGKSRAIFL